MQETLENKKVLIKHEEVSDIKQLLEECFATDIDLMNRYHIEAPAPLFACVERTYKDLLSCPDIIFYKIYELSKIIGYFCKEKDRYGNMYLTGFFIKPEYRKADYIKSFWDIVDKEIGEDYFIGLYKKNKRAVDFVVRGGAEFFFEGIDITGNDYVSYKMKIKCQ